MKEQTKNRIMSVGFLAGALALVVGFSAHKPSAATSQAQKIKPPRYTELPEASEPKLIPLDSNSGTLTVPITQFSSGDNGQSCFPAAQGWNRYTVLFYFLGPNVNPLPNPNTYPNPNNLNSVTLDTLDTANGTNLDTGIVILNNLNPSEKVCNDDASPTYAYNPKLSQATFSPTGSGKKYRAGIHYKTSTLGSLTNIVIHWSYP
jgi:hypothetical protein